MKKLIPVSILTWLLSAQSTFAALGPFDQGPEQPPSQGQAAAAWATVLGIIHKITDLIFQVGGVLAVLIVVIGGLYYITGHADSGKKIIMAVVIGLAIISFAYLIIDIVFKKVPQ